MLAATSTATSSPWVIVLLAVIGSGGLGSFALALIKLRPEANSAAVSQAKDANETLVSLNQRLEEENQRLLLALTKREDDLATAQATIRTLQDVITGMRIWENDEQFPPRDAGHNPTS